VVYVNFPCYNHTDCVPDTVYMTWCKLQCIYFPTTNLILHHTSLCMYWGGKLSYQSHSNRWNLFCCYESILHRRGSMLIKPMTLEGLRMFTGTLG